MDKNQKCKKMKHYFEKVEEKKKGTKNILYKLLKDIFKHPL